MESGFFEKIPCKNPRNCFKKTFMIQRAHELKDLRIPPGNHLEKLKGDRKDQYSIKIKE